MPRRGHWLLIVGLLAACGSHSKQDAVHVTDPDAAVLRAGDMPHGYREGDDTSCGAVPYAENGSDQLNAFLGKEHPKACVIELDRVWAADVGPRNLTSAAWVFRDSRGAERAFRIRNELLGFSTAFTIQSAKSVGIGDQAKLLHGQGLNHPATGVVWRSGNVVAMLVVEPADDDAALAFARRQAKRIEGTAARGPHLDTVEVELDDPALKLPVYWLGRSFDPRGALPELTLGTATALATGPGNTVKLDYGGAAGGAYISVTLDLWTPAAWRHFRHTLLGRLVWDSPCARKTVVPLANGRAEIFEGYGTPRPLERPCPKRAPDRVIAHVYFKGVVVAVDMPYCYVCAAAAHTTKNPYETLAGMTAIARGLELRR